MHGRFVEADLFRSTTGETRSSKWFFVWHYQHKKWKVGGMASNKGTRGLDQSTRNTLSALDAVLAEMPVKTIRPDEFTLDQYVERRIAMGDDRTHSGHRALLDRMCKAGKLKQRKILVNGKECNAYSLP
jgi:hypothetical protein